MSNWQRFQKWLGSIPISDPLQQRQAHMLQIMLLVIIAACIIGIPLNIGTANEPLAILPLISYPLLLIASAVALVQLRRGRFAAAVNLVTVGCTLAIGIALLAAGFDRSEIILIAFSIPVALAGLALGRRGLALAAGLSAAIVLVVALLTIAAPGMVGFVAPPAITPIAAFGTFVLLIGVLSLFLDLFGSSLRAALAIAQQREHELEQLRASLELTVHERTASLEQALQAGEEREARLAQILVDLNLSEATIRELSAPVIPALPGVLVAPLIGALDQTRAGALTTNILSRVEQSHTRYVIFDITGVPLVDTQVAHLLLQTAAAVRLLGARALIVGIRPEVAQTIVTLGIDVGEIAAYPDLQGAVSALLAESSEPRAKAEILEPIPLK